jgi:glycosyltransferase involved in cell wall biosynthesis
MNARLEAAVRDFLTQKKLLGTSNDGDVKNLPFVTVGVCVKNSERTIRECLESIVNSDYDKLELEMIVVDGNSVDDTVAVTREILEKSCISFKILSDGGKGLGYARQVVVDNARGEYVCWVDGDNVLPRNFLRAHAKFAKNHPKASLLIPVVLFKERQLLGKLEGYRWLLPTLNAIGKRKMPYLAMQGTFASLKALRSIGGFNKAIKGAGEDIELICRMKRQGHIVTVNPNAWIYHIMRTSWKDLYKQVSWWAKTQPRLSKTNVLKQTAWRTMLYIKLFPLVITHFSDYTGVFIPLYMSVWNAWYFIHSVY